MYEERMERKRPRGGRRVGMLDDLIEGTYGEMKIRSEDRVS